MVLGSRDEGRGLLLIIPFLAEEITCRDLAKAVLRFFYHPVISGDLRVEVDDGAETWVIDAASAEAHVDELDWGSDAEINSDDLGGLFGMLRRSRTLQDHDYLMLTEPALRLCHVLRKWLPRLRWKTSASDTRAASVSRSGFRCGYSRRLKSRVCRTSMCICGTSPRFGTGRFEMSMAASE